MDIKGLPYAEVTIRLISRSLISNLPIYLHYAEPGLGSSNKAFGWSRFRVFALCNKIIINLSSRFRSLLVAA